MELLRSDSSSFWPRAGVWTLVAFLGAGGFVIAFSRVTPHPTLVEWLAVGGLLCVGCLGIALYLFESLLLMRDVRDKRDAAIAAQRDRMDDNDT